MSPEILVNGLAVDVERQPEVVENVLLPALAQMRPRPGHRRAFAFLAGPPGSGKSTLGTLIKQAADAQGVGLDVVGMDGFHHRQTYLASHEIVVDGRTVALAAVKGAPESFDLARLDEFLSRSAVDDLSWPTYDRRLHDVVDDAVPVAAERVLVEGNWLLLDEPGWRELARHAALTILIEAPFDLLVERLVSRKQAGGLSREESEAFVMTSDQRNVRRCLERSTKNNNLNLRLLADGQLEEVKQ